MDSVKNWLKFFSANSLLGAGMLATTTSVATADSVFQKNVTLASPDQTVCEALSIERGLALLDERNRSLQAARSNINYAAADRESAAARPNPILSYNSISINPRAGIGGGGWQDKRIDHVLRIDQTIERGDKRALRIAAAEEAIQAAQFDYTDTLRQQILTFQIAYYDLKLANEKLAITKDNSQLFTDTLQRSELRYKTGDISGSDLARIRVDALRADSDYANAKNDLRLAQSQLAVLLGIEACANQLSPLNSWPNNANLDNLPNPETLAQQRPDVQAALHRVEAARQGQKVANSLRTRDITVGMQYERYRPDSSNTYGFGIAIPLFLGYDYRGEIRRAATAFDQAEFEYRKQLQESTEEIARSQQTYQNAVAREKNYLGTILPAARKAAAAVEFAWKNGAASLLEWLDARRTLRSVEFETSSAQADSAKALAVLNAAQYVKPPQKTSLPK